MKDLNKNSALITHILCERTNFLFLCKYICFWTPPIVFMVFLAKNWSYNDIFLRCQLSHICYPPLQGLGRDGGQAGDGGERCEPDPPPPLLLPLTHPVLQQGAQLGRHEQPPAPPHRQDRQAGAELCREQCHLQEVSAHLCRPVQGPKSGSAQGQDIKVGKTF